MMLFLVASETKCIEIEADDMRVALDRGMDLLKQDRKFGNVAAIIKPKTKEKLEKTLRSLVVSIGECYECGFPDYESMRIEQYIRERLVTG